MAPEKTHSTEAVKTWQPWLPPLPDGPFVPPDASSFTWSPLTTETFPPHPGLISAAHWAYEAVHKNPKLLHPYVVTIGAMGAGKSTLVDTLHQTAPQSTRLFAEEYWRISPLADFYQHLKTWVNSPTQTTIAQLHRVQAQVQGGFAALKFTQILEAAILLPFQPVVQDVWSPADTTYVIAHTQLGIMSQSNFQYYSADVALRHQLLPPHVRYPIVLYPTISLHALETRIRQVRGRDFETGIPPNYLQHLHQVSSQLAKALEHLGYPVISVDAENHDFRPENGGLDHARQLWDKIYQLHREQVLPRLGLG